MLIRSVSKLVTKQLFKQKGVLIFKFVLVGVFY